MTEDLSVFFGDLGVDVTIGASTIKGILDQPDELFADGRILSTEYTLTVRTSQVTAVTESTTLTISAVTYRVRKIQKIDDGALTRLTIGKT